MQRGGCRCRCRCSPLCAKRNRHSLRPTTQQARLRFRRHVADFVEEQRAAVRLFELADLLSDRARECTAFVPEQLAFEQIVRDRRHIDRHERTGLARAKLVDRLGDQFLARAAFTGDQYREIVAQDPRDHPEHALHRGTAANQRKRTVFAVIRALEDRPTGNRLRNCLQHRHKHQTRHRRKLPPKHRGRRCPHNRCHHLLLVTKRFSSRRTRCRGKKAF